MFNRAGNFPSLSTDIMPPSHRWEETVADFSNRDLTFPTDRLDALGAVGKAFEIAHGYTFWYGMLQKYWDWSLLWVPMKIEPRRATDTYGAFPSWSWLSYDGQVLHAGYYRGALELQPLIDWRGFVTLWDGQRSYTMSGVQTPGGDNIYQGCPAGLMVFGKCS